MKVIIPETFTPIQKICCDYIEKLIEEASNNFYAAGWLKDIELELYSDTFKNKSRYFDDHIHENLIICSKEINGWVMWCDINMSPSYFNHDDVVNRIETINKSRIKNS